MEEDQEPLKRVTILNHDDQFKWVLPDDMAKYASSYFNQYIQEQDLKESILTKNPVPSTISEVSKLADFMVLLLKESRQKNKTKIKQKQKKQKKNTNVMGPLSKLWHVLESATTAADDEADEPLKIY